MREAPASKCGSSIAKHFGGIEIGLWGLFGVGCQPVHFLLIFLFIMVSSLFDELKMLRGLQLPPVGV